MPFSNLPDSPGVRSYREQGQEWLKVLASVSGMTLQYLPALRLMEG